MSSSEAGGQVCGRFLVCVGKLVEVVIFTLFVKWYFFLLPVKHRIWILFRIPRIARGCAIYLTLEIKLVFTAFIVMGLTP